MDTAITRIGGVVLDELRSAGYMGSTIGQYEKTIRALTGYARRHGTSIYTPALGAGFASLTTSPRTGRFSAQRRSGYRRLVAVFDSYVATGRVDLSVRKRGGGGSQPAGNQFVALDASWEAEMADRGLAPATREEVFWRSWHRCRPGGRRPPCSGWCRTSGRSWPLPAAPT
jgi:hypothetical protein